MDKALYDNINQVETTHWWYKARREIIFDWVKRTTVIDRNHQVLDIGCGTGFNITYLHQLGYNQVAGLDVSPDALAYCRSHQLKELLCGNAEKLPIQPHSYDIILTLDMLEHLPDDRSALSEIFRVLKPGGSLFIFVPAFQFLWSFQDEISHHQRRYTAKELREKILQAGFELSKLTYVNSLLFPIVWLGRTLLRAFPKYFKITSESQMNPEWMNGLLQRIFLIELPLLRFINLPLGVSILCVCKKSM
jgi:2-polyprenyl-3-methyl-5-hydroxy-6-metoxy-1,4-benzoquinol methylase